MPSWSRRRASCSHRRSILTYVHAIYDKNFLFYIKNTLFISVASTIIVVITGSLAAYSFARYNVGDGHLLFFILSTKMFPAIAVILPYFLIFRDVGKTGIGSFLGTASTSRAR